jgi:hypothetical protein
MQTIYTTLRPKEQSQLLEEYVTVRAFMAVVEQDIPAEAEVAYVDQDDE